LPRLLSKLPTPLSAISNGVVDGAERGRDVLGLVAVDLADEAQGEVELLVILPARVLDAAHQAEQSFANGAGRADGDEQAVHGALSRIGAAEAGEPVFLETRPFHTILSATAQDFRRQRRV
jgi:hypothetical protein